MTSSISSSSVQQTGAVAGAPVQGSKVASASNGKTGEQSPAAKTDSVSLSAVAQASVAALKEASETPAQTAKEAQGGDLQAKRLIARQAASKISNK